MTLPNPVAKHEGPLEPVLRYWRPALTIATVVGFVSVQDVERVDQVVMAFLGGIYTAWVAGDAIWDYLKARWQKQAGTEKQPEQQP